MKRFKKAYLEITTACNLNCSFCHGTARPSAFLSIEDFSDYAGQLRPYTDYLYLHVMGEPLLHPQLEELLDISQDFGFRIIITTNGTLVSSKAPILLKAAALDKINISLHSFEANQKNGTLEDYVSQCIAFAKLEKSFKVNFRLWNLSGLDSRNEQILDMLHSAFPGDWICSRTGTTLADNTYLQFAEKFDWPDLSAADYGEHGFCFGLRDQIGVLCDGTVIPCCLDSEGSIALGNLNEQMLEDVLNGSRAKQFYEAFSRRYRSEELCRHCGYANRFSQ